MFTLLLPCPLLGKCNGYYGVAPIGVCAGVFANLVINLSAADHDLDTVTQAGFFERLNGGLHRIEGQCQEAAQAYDLWHVNIFYNDLAKFD